MIYAALLVGALGASSIADVDPASIDARLAAVVSAHSASTRLETLATSAGGRPIQVITIGDPATLGKRVPTLLLVAGSDARHQTGIEVALAIAERLAASPPAWLARASISILPCLNPDGLARSGPAADFGRLVLASDADGDGRMSEDGGDDLDGDRRVLMMRVKSPAPSTGLVATLCADSDFPQLMRAPDSAKAERPVYAVLIEGIDNDGDGRFNEDGVAGSGGGGLDLDQQWPGFWPEFRDGAGQRPLQTDETLALAKWCQAHPQIASVVVFGRHDTLVSVPEAGKMDPSGQVPLGIEGDDKAMYEAISARFKEITGINESTNADSAGSFLSWAYTNLGVPAFGTPVWVRPDLVKEEKRGGVKPSAPAAAPEPDPATPKPEATPAVAPRPEAKSDESKWLRYFEEHKDLPGFVDWKPWKHPQLGEVEIGGFVPGARMNAPQGALTRLIDQQLEFLGELASRFAVIEPRTWVTRLGPGLWRIDLRLANTGRMATRAAIGAKSRAKLPTIMTLDIEPSRLVAGRKIVRAEAIAPDGGIFDTSWTVRADDGTSLKVRITDPMMEPVELSIPLTVGEEAKP
jgi:hypothetical protein